MKSAPRPATRANPRQPAATRASPRQPGATRGNPPRSAVHLEHFSLLIYRPSHIGRLIGPPHIDSFHYQSIIYVACPRRLIDGRHCTLFLSLSLSLFCLIMDRIGIWSAISVVVGCFKMQPCFNTCLLL